MPLDLSMTHHSKTTVIAIAGASASGKSLFAETIYRELLPELGSDGISIIKEDAYYRDQSHLLINERITKVVIHTLIYRFLNELIF